MTRSQAGFTLFEVLVAVTIIALLLTTVYGVFSSVSGAKARLETTGEGYHQARVLFERISREVRGAYVPAGHPDALFAGSNGDIPFLELSTSAATPQGGGKGGINVVRYEVQIDSESSEGRKVLLRSEVPLHEADRRQEGAYRLATGLEELRWRYYDGQEWQEEWSAKRGAGGAAAPGQMLELRLTMQIDNQPVDFLSTFEIPEVRPR
jgi:general secretion pathway protein J